MSSAWTDTEIYNKDDLVVIRSSYDWCSYVVRTPLFSIVVCERYGMDEDIWDITILDRSTPQKTLMKMHNFNMPEFMEPFNGHNCSKLDSAKKVNYLINRALNLKAFL